MPKAERGTPKDIANRIKAKGLQKLKFYCQMCQKQCRDANGFKCHITSESHLRQMKIFSDNAGGILDKYSKDFEKVYVQTLRMRHGTKKVNANNVYQEVISDKQHIHMNATHWTTLSEFVQYLGKTGKCIVEESERGGWDIQYIERDVAILARKEALQRREQAEKAAEEAQAQRMEIQRIEAAKALDRAGGAVSTEATSLERTDDTKPIKVAISKSIGTKKNTKTKSNSIFEDEEEDDDIEIDENQPKLRVPVLGPPTLSSNTNSKQGKRKERSSDKYSGTSGKRTMKHKDQFKDDSWLYRDIIVRIINKNLADGKYFKRKAIIDRVIDNYMAEVEVLDSGRDAKDGGDILRLDQDDLETVVPKERGKKVRILKGHHRGSKAILVDANKKLWVGTLELKDGTILKKVPYEDFSKLA